MGQNRSDHESQDREDAHELDGGLLVRLSRFCGTFRECLYLPEQTLQRAVESSCSTSIRGSKARALSILPADMCANAFIACVS